ncbi:hypothetical protein ABW21_db0205691 [Orbilia brochopaga]|nr:hypothetical protein ABW21_db0205691 [Drechslerella brochopaga]
MPSSRRMAPIRRSFASIPWIRPPSPGSEQAIDELIRASRERAEVAVEDPETPDADLTADVGAPADTDTNATTDANANTDANTDNPGGGLPGVGPVRAPIPNVRLPQRQTARVPFLFGPLRPADRRSIWQPVNGGNFVFSHNRNHPLAGNDRENEDPNAYGAYVALAALGRLPRVDPEEVRALMDELDELDRLDGYTDV